LRRIVREELMRRIVRAELSCAELSGHQMPVMCFGRLFHRDRLTGEYYEPGSRGKLNATQWQPRQLKTDVNSSDM